MRWGGPSLAGHLVLLGIPFAVIESALGCLLNFRQGNLTVGWAIYLIATAAAIGVAAATLVWYAVSRPLIKRGKRVKASSRGDS